MEIKEDRLLLFIKLYREQFGVTLSRSEAHRKAALLLHYTRMYLNPLAKTNEDGINNTSNTNN
nr:hypothetical protein [Mucilaginibacter sp. X4EP1]